MEIFVRVKILLRFIGILQFDDPHKKWIQFTLRIIISSSMSAFILSTFWFLCFESNTLFERAESFYAFSVAISFSIIYCIMLWQEKKILELIVKIERRILECMTIHKQQSYYYNKLTSFGLLFQVNSIG